MTRPWVIVAGDFSTRGGMDRANHALASRLAAAGHEVHLVAHRVEPALARHAVLTHRAARPLGSHALGMPFLARKGWREAAALSGRAPRVVVNGGNCAWPDVNWVHYVHAAYDPPGEGAALSRGLARAQRRYVLARERTALANARLVLCNSARTYHDVVERLGVHPSRARVVYYGVDAARFSRPAREERIAAREKLQVGPDEPVALFVGALGDRRKGFDALFEAWESLCGDPSWRATLVVAGRGRELPAWIDRTRRASLESRVRFLGFSDDVPALLAAADVLVHPARYEAYGLSAHEAICRGVPVVVTRAAGVAERLPSTWRPLLLERVTGADLARALREWDARRDEFAAAAATLAPQWRARSWDDMADEIAALVESC